MNIRLVKFHYTCTYIKVYKHKFHAKTALYLFVSLFVVHSKTSPVNQIY